MTVVTRFAPSPTGFLHIGGARTALFSYLYAKRHGGQFLLRIEDTDRERSTQAAVDAIFEGMDWLGLKSDIEPVFQAARFDRHKEVALSLQAAGHAYWCYASREELDALRESQTAAKQKPRYDGRWRPEDGKSLPSPPAGVSPVLRFKNPLSGSVRWEDQIKGLLTFNNEELDDLIILRSDGTPTYNFCVVVDDADMGITHVVRGDDHVNNTPRQINLLHAMGRTPPTYAHVPMILGSDGAKLSKRHGALGVMEYRNMGFIPDAVLNYLVRLSWSHGDQELFSREQMQSLFDTKAVNSAPARFDMKKLIWVNHETMKAASPEAIEGVIQTEFRYHLNRLGLGDAVLAAGPSLVQVLYAQRERCQTLIEMVEKSRFWYEDFAAYVEKDAVKHLVPAAKPRLAALIEALNALSDWTAASIHTALHGVIEAQSLKLPELAMPIRVACCGMAISPPVDVTLELLGRERTLARLHQAVAFIA